MTLAPAAPLSRTPRQGLRRARGWLVLVLVLVIGSGIALAVQLSLANSSKDPMGADNPAPQGGQALASVLREHGVDVRAAGSLRDATGEAASRADTTILLSDPNGILDATQLRRLSATAADIVVVGPGMNDLEVLAPGVALAGGAARTSSSDAGCDIPAASRAGSLSGVRSAYRVDGDATGCFPVGGAYALAQQDTDGTRVSVVGAELFDNAGIGVSGNAALALGLLGEHRTLVWYLPGAADAGQGGAPTLAQLTPGWLTPFVVLAIAVVAATAVWRGRRFGPLVVEDLPVEVPAGETMRGRAQLYRTSRARTHALDQLRVGALRRIAGLCGLPPSAPVELVVGGAASVSGWALQDVRGALVDDVPGSDAALRAATARLADLERDLRRASPDGRPPGPPADPPSGLR